VKRVAVEHSEPGYVIEFSDSLEFTLRHLSWERARGLARELLEFAKGFPGGEVLQAFHLETPGEAGRMPPCLATLADVDENAVRAVVAAARERLGLPFEFQSSLLLEGREWTREDYVDDLAVTMNIAEEACSFYLPGPLKRHRLRLLEEQFRALYPAPEDVFEVDFISPAPRLGHRWVEAQAGRWKKSLETVDEAVRQVARYLLVEQDPGEIQAEDLRGWCLVAAHVDAQLLPRYFEVLERRTEYLWQRFCLACGLLRLTWQSYLKKKAEAYIEEARRQYTVEAVEAMERLFGKIRSPLASLLEEDGEDGEDEERVEDGNEGSVG
jgi:hypothetical protein